MLLFCPVCSNAVVVDKNKDGYNEMMCKTCPWFNPVESQVSEQYEFETKRKEDIIGGAAAWENVDKTKVKCVDEKCDSEEAHFRQVQTRSADEPMTNFFHCVKCHRLWQD